MTQQDDHSRFSAAFKAWFTQELPVKQWLNDVYAKYNVRNKKWELVLPSADSETALAAYPTLLQNEPFCFDDARNLIELGCARLISPAKRPFFIDEINAQLAAHALPFKLNAQGLLINAKPQKHGGNHAMRVILIISFIADIAIVVGIVGGVLFKKLL